MLPNLKIKKGFLVHGNHRRRSEFAGVLSAIQKNKLLPPPTLRVLPRNCSGLMTPLVTAQWILLCCHRSVEAIYQEKVEVQFSQLAVSAAELAQGGNEIASLKNSTSSLLFPDPPLPSRRARQETRCHFLLGLPLRRAVTSCSLC